jgi:hypothetical protein
MKRDLSLVAREIRVGTPVGDAKYVGGGQDRRPSRLISSAAVN